ncbi:hypothetical protein [Psychrosphaera algicola]|uniref:Ureidoglycolate lyase n=1 Tax=Psychrosphaera algicola TaxID=3023714 RepID=A0ABT5FFA3_9GAMM|nr:hypothetical protein [Psychrosphaera sp. G1-22]MDC2889297.1 hypothetical protein [Psychrosphaera sp. G1-22]
MKLVRFGDLGQEKPGILDSQGELRDASSHFDDYDKAFLTITVWLNYKN